MSACELAQLVAASSAVAIVATLAGAAIARFVGN